VTGAPPLDPFVRAVAAVHESHDVREALDAIVTNLGEVYALWSASIMLRIGDGEQQRIRIIANWSPAGTILDEGLEVPVDLTPDMRKVADALDFGHPVQFTMGEVDLGLIGDMAREYGTASVVVAPLMWDDSVGGALLLTSAAVRTTGPRRSGEADRARRRRMDQVIAHFLSASAFSFSCSATIFSCTCEGDSS
jgi:hypothetical protein